MLYYCLEMSHCILFYSTQIGRYCTLQIFVLFFGYFVLVTFLQDNLFIHSGNYIPRLRLEIQAFPLWISHRCVMYYYSQRLAETCHYSLTLAFKLNFACVTNCGIVWRFFILFYVVASLACGSSNKPHICQNKIILTST